MKLVLDLIEERESRKKELVPGFRRDDVWTTAFPGVTVLLTFYELVINILSVFLVQSNVQAKAIPTRGVAFFIFKEEVHGKN